jgi:putative membrane protein
MSDVVARRDSEPPGGGRFDEAGDATRRTHLANERTFLAWWRSGLTALGVGLAVGRVVPAFTAAAHWPYAVVGAAYALFGLGLVLYGTARHRAVEEAIMSGGFTRPHRAAVTVFSTAASLIALATIALIVAEP